MEPVNLLYLFKNSPLAAEKGFPFDKDTRESRRGSCPSRHSVPSRKRQAPIALEKDRSKKFKSSEGQILNNQAQGSKHFAQRKSRRTNFRGQNTQYKDLVECWPEKPHTNQEVHQVITGGPLVEETQPLPGVTLASL